MWNMILLVPGRKRRAVIVNLPDDWQTFVGGYPCIGIAVEAKNLYRADVVGRRLYVDDETAREKVIAVPVSFRVRVDENVGEWSCCVADVGGFLERIQQ